MSTSKCDCCEYEYDVGTEHRCPDCSGDVCIDCWNEERGICECCAASEDLHIYPPWIENA
jgi:hypothetical protein